MFLSRKDIENFIRDESLKITPFDPAMLKASSYTFKNRAEIEIQPSEFVILESYESIQFPENLGGLLSTRGSIAKLGLDCLISDIVIEPGSEGILSFCTINHSNKSIILKAGTPIVKCLFYTI